MLLVSLSLFCGGENCIELVVSKISVFEWVFVEANLTDGFVGFLFFEFWLGCTFASVM